MNKRVLPVFLVASCLAASAAAQTTDSSPPPKDFDRRREDRCCGDSRARAARCLLRHGEQHDPK